MDVRSRSPSFTDALTRHTRLFSAFVRRIRTRAATVHRGGTNTEERTRSVQKERTGWRKAHVSAPRSHVTPAVEVGEYGELLALTKARCKPQCS